MLRIWLVFIIIRHGNVFRKAAFVSARTKAAPTIKAGRT